jgi:peptidoglycan/LPS O-acetylase OafA/YrhL
MATNTASNEPEVAPVRRLGFVPALDGLRGVAILLVVAVHFRRTVDPWTTQWINSPRLAQYFNTTTTAPDNFLLVTKPHPSLVAQLVPKGGFLGVDIFFVLSGFLISSILLREQSTHGRVGFGAFYQRRALRLLPALFAFLAAHVIYASIIHVQAAVERSSIIAAVFYYYNWKLVYSFPVVRPELTHLWSLSIEEQFYLVWPVALILLLGGVRRRLPTAVAVTSAGVVAIAVWRMIVARHMSPALVYFRTDAQADALLVGALAALLWTRGAVPLKRYLAPAAWVALGFMIVCIFTLESDSRFLYDGGFTLIAIAVAVILLATVETSWGPTRALHTRPLRAVGRVSYGLYLWHVLVFSIVVDNMRHKPVVVTIALALGVTAIVTALSWYAVERPFLRWKARLDHRERAGEDLANITAPQ